MKYKENVRNFCIIAHIDHGKSTLADRLLEKTGTVAQRDMQDQSMDSMDIERERGITIKLNSARMNYKARNGKDYILNLIDTPGHVDFSYEVSRSLAACEGALLIVDATQGVEAQTLANVYLAAEQNLEIIPVINKIDLPSADVEAVKAEIEEVLGIDASLAIPVSAKTGEGIEDVLEAVVDLIPPPVDTSDKPLRALVFDSAYDPYLGTLCFFKVIDGKIKLGDKVKFMASGKEYDVIELGYQTPARVQVDELVCGDVGYFAGSIKELTRFVGDTLTTVENSAKEPLPGYKEALPMVFSGMYPVDNEDYADLKESLEKLKLSDSSITFEPETSSALGFGFRCGFLTFAGKNLTDEHYDALVKKLMGDIRSSVSCCSTPPQAILLRAFKEPSLEADKKTYRDMLEKRYHRVKAFLQTKKDHKVLQPMPFNSGYFMSLHCSGIDAEALRQKLLHEKGIGVVAIDSKTIRVAFSSIDVDIIDQVYQAIYDTADEMVR